MRKGLISILVLFCLGAAAQVSDTVDPDWQAEMDLFNRFADAQDYAGAFTHAQKSLDIAQQKKLDVRSFAGSDYAMAWARYHQRRYAEAEQLQREALRLRESVLPPTHFRVMQSVHQLAETLYAEQKYDDAEPLLARSMAFWAAMEDRDGPSECSLGVTRADLGYIRIRQGKLDEAQKLFDSAIESWNQTGAGCGELHPMWDHIVWLYSRQQRSDKVEAAYKQVLRDLQTAEEQDDFHYFYYSLGLGDLYVAEKRYAEAEPLFKRTIDADGSPEVNPTLMGHALYSYHTLLVATGRAAEAAKVQTQFDTLTKAGAQGESPK